MENTHLLYKRTTAIQVTNDSQDLFSKSQIERSPTLHGTLLIPNGESTAQEEQTYQTLEIPLPNA